MVQILINGNEFNNVITAEVNDTLNEINKAIFNFSNVGNYDKSLLQIGNIIEYITNDNKTFKFIIKSKALTENNLVKCVCLGIEQVTKLNDVDIDSLSNTSSKTTRAGIYNSVLASTIFEDIMAQITGWSVSTTITDTITNYRINDTMTHWNALSKLCNEQAYEIDIDYSTQEIIIEQDLGNSQVATLNEKLEFEGIPTYTQQEAEGKRVIVFGKGDGGFQIKATATASGFNAQTDETKKIYDSNIISQAEAQKRADNELIRYQQEIEHYLIPQLRNNINVSLSDTVIVNSQNVGLENKELKVVRIMYKINGNNETTNIEVTNAEYARAYKSSKQKVAEQNAKLRDSRLNMQGSGNTLNWSRGLNANSTAPLRTVFFIPEDYVSETGQLEIQSLKVDYEVEPFREGAGTATEDNVSPSLTSSTDVDSHNHNARDISSHDHGIPSQTSDSTEIIKNYGVYSFSESISTSSWGSVASITIDDDVDIITCQIRVVVTSSSGANLWYRLDIGGTVHALAQLNSNAVTGNEYVINLSIPYVSNSTNDVVELYLRSFSGSISVGFGSSFDSELRVFGTIPTHSHNISFQSSNNENANVSDDNESPGVTGAAESHNHNVVIGSQVSDANLINATGVSLYLDYWNGTSWVEKNSILNTGNLLDTNVDISNNGTYPDVAGYWRVRTTTNSTDADFVETIVRLKHNLNNN